MASSPRRPVDAFVPPRSPRLARVRVALVVSLVAAAALVVTGAMPAQGGGAEFYGSMGGSELNRPIVGMAPTVSGKGYWLVASDGGIFSFGDAKFYGSMGGSKLNRPIVGMAPTVSGKGYWLVASDGGIFSFGDATFHGTTASADIQLPIVGMAVTNTGAGYWLAGADGRVYAFGDAPWHGQIEPGSSSSPVAGIDTAEYGTGYWLVTATGAVRAFGDATDHGGAQGLDLNSPILDLIPSPHGYGYWLLAADGGVFSFGDTAPFFGSTGDMTLNEPVVGGAAARDGRGYWFVASDGGIFSFSGAAPGPRPPFGLTPRRIPTPDAPLRVMALGDSLTIAMQDGLDTVLRRTGEALGLSHGKFAYGFTAQYPADPPCLVCAGLSQYAPSSLDAHVRHDNFDAVVMIVGGWDYIDRIVGSTVYEVGTPAWSAWYRGVQDDAIRRLTSAGAVVYWVGYPACNISSPKDPLYNALAQSAAARHPGSVVYLDLHAAVCPNGPVETLSLPNGTPVQLLNADAHFTPQGAEWVGYWLTAQIGPTFKLATPD